MAKYLFITYGETGWRGVQIRALRIARYLPKNDVLFWNGYDSTIFEKENFQVETKEMGITHSSSITFPEDTEMVIFSDLPTNEFFNYAVFDKALKDNLKIVINEQIYRKGQLQETVYKRFVNFSDLFLVNALSSFKSEETEIVRVVPPQIEFEFNIETRQSIKKKYEIEEDAFLIFGVGYHKMIQEKMRQLATELAEKNDKFHLIVSGTADQTNIVTEKQLTILPFDIGDDFFKLMYASDLMLVKFGFLQILESLSLGKPTVVLGQGGFTLQNSDKLDPMLRSVLYFEDDINDHTVHLIEQLIRNKPLYLSKVDEIKKLHSGELYGGKKAAYLLEQLGTKKVHKKSLIPKHVALLVNNDMLDLEKWLQKQPSIYPLCFVTGIPTEQHSNKRIPDSILALPLERLTSQQSDEILPHSFKELHLFSRRRLDGFTDISPWYSYWIDHIYSLLKDAEKIYLTKNSMELCKPLLTSMQSKVVMIEE